MVDEHRELPPDRLWQPTTGKWCAAIFGASLAYAVVRYHLAGDVEWRHLPLFILNKATSLAAVFFVASSDYRPLIDRDLTDRSISFMKENATAEQPFRSDSRPGAAGWYLLQGGTSKGR